MENRNYTVELWRASKAAASTCTHGFPPKKLHLNQDGIKRGGVAHVGEFFRRKYVDVSIAGGKFCPVQLRPNYSWRNVAIYFGFQLHFAPAIKHFHPTAITNASPQPLAPTPLHPPH